MGPDLSKIDKLMLALHKEYKLKKVKTDLFLGKQISTLDKGTLKLFQGQYTRKLLERHGLHECKTANTPLERLLEPSDAQSSKQQLTEYNSMIGGLQYLANNTRPGIAYAVNHLARFLTNPSEEHLQAARKVLRYVAKELDRGILFKAER